MGHGAIYESPRDESPRDEPQRGGPHPGVLIGTSFVDIDLRLVKGLESVNHYGPSHIGIDTIYRSDGGIPELFLRAAVPDRSSSI